MVEYRVHDKKVVYPELSYKIVGILFQVYNVLGHGHKEKTYEDAVAVGLEKESISFERQLYVPTLFEGKRVGHHYIDFLIDDRIVLELKRGERFLPQDIEQTYQYLQICDLRLGILARFTSRGVVSKRILNVYDRRDDS
jgi:GxxExxY protein